MTPEKTKQALTRLFGLLTSDGTEAKQLMVSMYRRKISVYFPFPNVVGHQLFEVEQLRAHAAWMCAEASQFVDDGRMEKTMRWLGYIGAIAHMLGLLTLDELKDLYRPDQSEES